MIVFLTLCYVAVLFLLLKIKVIKLTLWWKLSPLVWMVLLFLILFLPMQWGAPGGTVNVYQYVVEIVPNVTGQVTEVPVKPLEPLKQGDVLFKIEPRTFRDAVEKFESSLKLARINLKRARELYAKRVGPKVDVDKFTAEVDKLVAELDIAKYDLESTVVKAPADGYIMGLTLRPGHRVAKFPMRSFMTFVSLHQNKVVLGVNQNSLRHVRIGHPAEVTFKLLPGKVFNAKVEKIAPLTPQGQLTPSGDVPLAPTTQNVAQPFAVILALDEDVSNYTELGYADINRVLPGGSFGSGAIYTDSVQTTHIIRKVMIRMDAWMNYIMPY
ncbi:MAG: HlyD family secretion protein [Gammaproteobacteria bacterium]|nr:HlyD family secretion protein [Gammaproteobacteria bacterium]